MPPSFEFKGPSRRRVLVLFTSVAALCGFQIFRAIAANADQPLAQAAAAQPSLPLIFGLLGLIMLLTVVAWRRHARTPKHRR
ncbi:MAG: hypothetical protein WAW88_06405 [Nocardioides sp.]